MPARPKRPPSDNVDTQPRRARPQPKRATAVRSSSSSGSSSGSDSESDSSSASNAADPIAAAGGTEFLIVRPPVPRWAPWTHISLSVASTIAGTLKGQQRDANTRKKLCAEFVRALAAETAYHEQRRLADEAASLRVGERAASLMHKLWHRVERSFALIAKADAEEHRRREALKQQNEFIKRSEQLTQELSLSLGARSGLLAPSSVSDAGADDGGVMDNDGTTQGPIESRLALFNTLDGARPLREYQSTALAWLVHRYEKRLNGILADEMGLGKTVQTIALLCYFAEHKGDWGPHLIVVPTPVVMNWGLELRRWAPGFKVIEYVGSAQERAKLRKGWNTDGTFNVCVTSFGTLMNDRRMFRSKAWGFLVVDEAHNLKNFNSAKYRGMFDLQAQHRLLLTGTPLQTSVMELWSLVHFVMPGAEAFQSDSLFRDWFSNPLQDMAAGRSELDTSMVNRLHTLLRPFMLRRLKVDVAKDLPTKREIVVQCRLSRRQREMYHGYLSLAETRSTISVGSFQGMVSVLLALRKVCNHPDLFAERPVVSPFQMFEPLQVMLPGRCFLLEQDHFLPRRPVITIMSSVARADDADAAWVRQHAKVIPAARSQNKAVKKNQKTTAPQRSTVPPPQSATSSPVPEHDATTVAAWLAFAPSLTAFKLKRDAIEDRRRLHREVQCTRWSKGNWARWESAGDMVGQLVAMDRVLRIRDQEARHLEPGARIAEDSPAGRFFCPSLDRRVAAVHDTLTRCLVLVPRAYAVTPPSVIPSTLVPNTAPFVSVQDRLEWTRRSDPEGFKWFHRGLAATHAHTLAPQFIFPDPRLLVHDCGKLQLLLPLLKKLRSEGHRCVIFTQFTGMIPVLCKFMAMFALSYLTFDGSTKPDVRQNIVERFNRDPHIFALLLTTRAGGVGLNLVGADTVIFYDNDWNPAMDLQAQDRCHRIGQRRSVTIYRLVSERTVEEGILRKARERKKINNVVIRGGGFHEWSAPIVMNSAQLRRMFVDLDEGDLGVDRDNDDGDDDDGADQDDEAAQQQRALEMAGAEDQEDRAALTAAQQEQAAAEGHDERHARGEESQLSFENGWTAHATARHVDAVRRVSAVAPLLGWAALSFQTTHPTTAAAIAKAERDALARKT